MRTTSSLAILALLLILFAAPAAADEPREPGPLVDLDAATSLIELEAKAKDPNTTWQERWRAYNDAKAAIEAIDGKKDKAKKEAAEAQYLAMRPVVAASLRRDEMPLGGWIMGVVAALILWGGFAVHVRIAAKHGKAKVEDES